MKITITLRPSGNPQPGCKILAKGVKLFNAFDYKNALVLFEQAARNNNECGQLLAGSMHYTGTGDSVPKNHKRAFQFFHAAADTNGNNNPAAQHIVGMMYIFGDGSRNDVKAGFKWLQISANGGWNASRVFLGAAYSDDMIEGVPSNKKQVIYWLEDAAHQMASHQTESNNRYLLFGTKQIEISLPDDESSKQAIDTISKVRKEEPIFFNRPSHSRKMNEMYFWYANVNQNIYLGFAQFVIATIYRDLLMTEHSELPSMFYNFQSMINWLKKSAENENPLAQFLLGESYEDGLGVEQDYGKALDLYRKALANGSDTRDTCKYLYKIGGLYYLGRGVPKDYSYAMKCFKKVLSQDPLHGGASYCLGEMYELGEGLPSPDPIRAMEYYERAFMNGVVEAAHDIGLMYSDGRPELKNDYTKAAYYFRKSANLGFPDSYFALGLMILEGQQRNMNLDQAITYFEEAIDTGFRLPELALLYIDTAETMKILPIVLSQQEYNIYNQTINKTLAKN